MIGAHAREGFERILFHALRTRLAPRPDDPCEIARAGEAGGPGLPHAHLAVLTLSGLAFRLLLILHFDEDERTVRHYVRDDGQRAFREVFLEISNLCCGALNQALQRHFPDLGMSTPYLLSAKCASYLAALKPDLLATYAVTLAGGVTLGATLCVCAHAPLDFVAQIDDVPETGGELELF